MKLPGKQTRDLVKLRNLSKLANVILHLRKQLKSGKLEIVSMKNPRVTSLQRNVLRTYSHTRKWPSALANVRYV